MKCHSNFRQNVWRLKFIAKDLFLKHYTELIENSKDTETQYWCKGQITDQSAL